MNGDAPPPDQPRRTPGFGPLGGTIHDWLNTGYMAILAGLFVYMCWQGSL